MESPRGMIFWLTITVSVALVVAPSGSLTW
jgi:hypothetical protein